jgi:dihydrodipicolinate synthase/N-acetylneuraminate lyase
MDPGNSSAANSKRDQTPNRRYHRCVLVSCEIPWDDNQRFLESVFRDEIRATLKNFNNLYVFGTSGEGYGVTNSQLREILQVFWEETEQDSVHPMVGIITMSTAQAIERIAISHDFGFRTFMITLPSWRQVIDREYMTFFRDICETFPDSKFLHYNLGLAGRVLNASDYRRIEDSFPNIVGTKTGSANSKTVKELVTQTSLQHFVGDQAFVTGSRYGECSILSACGILFPTQVNELFRLGVSGQFDKAEKLALEINRAAVTFFKPASESTPLGFDARVHGAWDKMFKRAAGLDMPFQMLSPYEHWDEEIYKACFKSLKAEFSDWLR